MNWLKKYQQGGSTYNPGGETSLKGINMYNPQQVTNPNMSLAEGSQPDPWAINNPNSQETMDNVYAERDRQTQIQTPQDQSYLKTTTKRTFGTPNWGYIAASNMVGDGLGFLANQGKNSSQNAMKRYNDQKLDPLNTLMANPNTSAQDQAGSGYYKMGGWLNRYQEGGETEMDDFEQEQEDYLFGFDDEQEQSMTNPFTEQPSRRELAQKQYALEDQRDHENRIQQEEFFASLVNSDYSESSNYSPSMNYGNGSSDGVLSGIFKNEGAKTGQPTNLKSSAVGRGQMIKGTREAMYKKLGFNNLTEAEQKYRTDPEFESRVINAYIDELSQRIPSSIKGKQRDYMIAKGWYTGNPNYPDDKVPSPEAGNKMTAGQYARRAIGSYQQGGIIDDPMGQWNHPGEITKIPSNEITMQGVNYPVLGISNTGDTQMMQPNQDYSFEGDSVTEYPMMQKGGSWINQYKQVADNNSVQIPLPTGKSIVTDNTPDTQNSFLSKMEGLRNSVEYDEKEKQKRINSRKEATNIVDNKKGSFTFPTGQSKDYSQMSTKEKKYVQGLALENRGRIFENEESITDMLNPLNWIGSMASNMSKAPYEAEQTNSYMPYAIALAEPLLMGRMMGSGTINPFSEKMWTNEISDKAFINTLGMGIPKKFSKKPSTILQDNIIPDNVVPPITSEPWQLKELPGLHIKSTMTGSPLEKQLSKQGEININSLSSYLGKSDVGQQDKYIINKVLAERFPNQAKINYNDFRKAVSEELIPLEKNFTKENASYGLRDLGYVESPLENTSITFSNKSKLGIGSNEHFINDGTLGHARVLVSKEEPKTMHVLESQSDYYQKNKTAEIADNLESAKENYKLAQIDYPDMKEVNDFWKRRIDELQSTLDKHNTSPNKIQKEFLGKTHQERLLQENMLYAAQQGKKSVRYPTSETAAKIQGYKKQSTNRPEALENNLPEIPTEIRFGENTQTQEFYRGEDYLPEHKTILKKYDNAPKMIKKTLGVDTKIVTDPKGNTWYEFDIPEAAKKRKFEMKALSIPTAIATGAATQEYQNGGQITNWIDKYKK